MAQTATQQTKNVCSKCGKSFDSAQELREHQAKCKGSGASAGTPAKPPQQSREEIERDMQIEEGFEAEDN